MTDSVKFLRIHAELALADGFPDESTGLTDAATELQELRHHAVLNWNLWGTCQCGARIESAKTHPHVTGCPVGEAVELERPETP